MPQEESRDAIDSEDREWALKRGPGGTYFSRAFRNSPTPELPTPVPLRWAYRVSAAEEGTGLELVKDETVLYTTPKGVQQIKALFVDDETRELRRVILQRFTVGTGKPHKDSAISLTPAGVAELLRFLRAIDATEFGSDQRTRVRDQGVGPKVEDKDLVRGISLDSDLLKTFVTEHHELVVEILDSGISLSDVLTLRHRRRALEEFQLLLEDPDHFAAQRREGKGPEDVWQRFFEANTWIFGYALSFQFLEPFGPKLEQTTVGATPTKAGHRVDGVMRTGGLLSSLCYVEIKHHGSGLLKQVKNPYRGEAWAGSDELAGGIAQLHRAVQTAVDEEAGRSRQLTDNGWKVGGPAFLYEPRSILVIGSLAEFVREDDINEEKYGCFEMLRRNVTAPEIITFDELYQRARAIVAASEDAVDPGGES